LLKIGGYAYIRFLIGFLPLANSNFLDFVYAITLFSCIWSAVSALFQTDLKRIVAYMSIGHMSLSILALNTFTISGFYSAVYTFLGHGLTSSALFILVGVLYDRHKVRHIKYYSGLQTVMPVFSLYVTFFIFCNIGFPGSPGFVAELLAFLSLGSVSFVFLALVFVSVFVLVFINL
jgi:NADH-quinone oxidoreductase subunit M